MKVEYQYDYMSRRVERKVWICTAGGANPTWQAAGYGWERFVYDEWNVVMVLNGSDNTAVKKYTWGLDLSGTLHGAGGIGGLLASDENGSGSGCTGKFWFFYDANGNVGQIFKYVPSPESVTLAAYCEYDPYGGILDSGGSGAYPSQNPVRFSTKWFDAETGLGYWGYRYYSPRLGRWMSRDPIGEDGSLNLQSYVLNQPGALVDPYGLYPPGVIGGYCPDGYYWVPMIGCVQRSPTPGRPRRDAGQCCRDAKAQGLDEGDRGGVVCCDGQKVACAWYNRSGNPSPDMGTNIRIDCTTEHKKDHFDKVDCSNSCLGDLTRPRVPIEEPEDLLRYLKEECRAHKVGLDCLKRRRDECNKAPNPSSCVFVLDAAISNAEAQVANLCGQVAILVGG